MNARPRSSRYREWEAETAHRSLPAANSNHCPFHYSRASSITLVLATSVRHAHPVRMSSAPTTPGCVLRYRHRPRARGEKTAGVLKMGRPPGFWAFWAETVAKTHRHAFAWPSGSGCCLGTCIWPTLPSSSHSRHLTCFVTYRCADSAGEMVDFGVWGLFATPDALATRQPLISKVPRAAR